MHYASEPHPLVGGLRRLKVGWRGMTADGDDDRPAGWMGRGIGIVMTPAVRRRVGWGMRGVAAVAVGSIGVAGAWIAWPLPAGTAAPIPIPRLVLEDRGGLPLRATRAEDGSRGGWTPVAEIDPRLIQAFVSAEDHRYFSHHGVDPRSVGRAIRDNVRGVRRSGASTLTMQTARLLEPEIDRSWGGKARQAMWALRLEAHLEKRAILEQYLNRVPLGQGAVGVSAAASLYFGGSARELSLGQAALLAGIARSPSRDNPLASPARAKARRDVVLGRMRRLGYATPDEVARALEEPVIPPEGAAAFLAPHFTTRVLREAEAAGTRDGTLRTSLDLELQTLLEGEVRHTVRVLRDRGARHAAAVAIDNATGEVLAWVGSPDFWEPEVGQVDMVVSPRQPGSALKPFLYGLAFDRGHTAATVIPDVPRSFATTLGPYRPQNYDRRFHGPVRAREALASSFNVPAVELAERVGVEALLETLHRAGFASLARPAPHYGLGLALGNGDVTLLELANAYRALANEGEWTQYRLRPAAPGDAAPPAERVMSREAAALVLDVLSDADARAAGFGTETPFDFPFPAAAKTGTSRHFTDNWAVGVTRGFTVAVWVGDFTGRPMKGVSGVTGAGPLLYRSMLAVASRRAPGALPTPAEAGLVPMRVCRLSGLRATPDCPSLVEWFVPGTQPSRTDDWERGGRVALPDEYVEWARAEGGRWAALARPGGERFRIVAPRDGDRYSVPAGVEARYATLTFRAAGAVSPVRWLVDGVEVPGGRWTLARGEHRVRAESATGADSVRIVVEGEQGDLAIRLP
ncbi:MAG TPA: penicillin-binding protein 1C [Longimicrobium sp.]|nr:penicillin-binding protein 1C [Longimicrobium sp.]